MVANRDASAGRLYAGYFYGPVTFGNAVFIFATKGGEKRSLKIKNRRRKFYRVILSLPNRRTKNPALKRTNPGILRFAQNDTLLNETDASARDAHGQRRCPQVETPQRGVSGACLYVGVSLRCAPLRTRRICGLFTFWPPRGKPLGYHCFLSPLKRAIG